MSILAETRFKLATLTFKGSIQHTARLQRVQYAVARVALYRQSRSSSLSSTELLNKLHWLPIEWRI